MPDVSLEQLYRQYSSPMLAYLYSLSQDLEVAQELWHETVIEAMQQWQTCIPDNPAAWFKRTAKNKFIDRYRHQKMTSEKADVIKSLLSQESDEMAEIDFGDEQLKLIFTCCHPALDFDKRVALTLNIIGGLSTEQVAEALLLNTTTLEQRLTRAKRKIKQAAIPFVVPEKNHLAERLNAVLKTLYLMYNTGTHNPQDPYQLSFNAMLLVQRLNQLLPMQAEIEGMLALMLFHDARKKARFDSAGKLIRLSDQDRLLWDPAAIEQADKILQTAMKRNALGVYQLQAAIQGVHCLAQNYQATDWQEIEALYRVHLNLDDSPVVKLNAIYAISMSRGVQTALTELQALQNAQQIVQYAPLYAVAADFHCRLGEWHEAIEQLQLAIKYSNVSHEIEHFQDRLHFCHKKLS